MSDVWKGINGLYFEYCEAINSNDRNRYAMTFCEDAVYAMAGRPPMVGRETIRGKADPKAFGLKFLFQVPPRFHILEHGDDTARVRAYTTEISNLRGVGNYYLASYLDECVIDDGAWRFKNRQGDVLYWGPADMMGERLCYPAPARY